MTRSEKHRFRRVLAGILSVVLVFCNMPPGDTTGRGLLSVFAEATESITDAMDSDSHSQGEVNPDDYYTEDIIWDTNDTMTRAQWLHNLAILFEMTVEDDVYPDNYFCDLEDTSPYYYDVLLNVEFGVVDVEAGGEVRPYDRLTREFAAKTLNYCLGYQSRNITWTFSDASEFTAAEDAQIAVNRHWFSLIDGKFCPNNYVTDLEVELMIYDIQQVLLEDVIEEDYESTYEFDASVIQIPNGTEVVAQDGMLAITNCPVSLKNGDKFVVYLSGIPKVCEAVEVMVQDSVTTIVTSEFDGSDLITSIDAEGVVDADTFELTLEENTTLTIEEVQSATTYGLKPKFEKIYTFKQTIKTDNGKEIQCIVNMENPKIKFDFSTKPIGASVIFDADASFSVVAEEKIEIAKEIKLGKIGIPGIGGLELVFGFEIGSSLSLIQEIHVENGIRYTYKDGFRLVKNFKNKGFSFQAEGSTNLSIGLQLGITEAPIIEGKLYAKSGVEGKFSTSISNNASGVWNCADFSAYWFANIGMEAKVEVALFSTSYEEKIDIYDEENSPLRIVKHYDNGKEVRECTKDQIEETTTGPIVTEKITTEQITTEQKTTEQISTEQITTEQASKEEATTGQGASEQETSTNPDTGNIAKKVKFYTPADSHNAGSGWASGFGSKGYDKSGKEYTIYTYTLDDQKKLTITGYKGKAVVLQIPEKIDGYTVVGIAANAFAGKTALKSVRLPNTVTKIGEKAFKNCYNLKKVILSNGLTSIEAETFAATGLNRIEIPDSVIGIAPEAFYGCIQLSEVKLSKSLKELGVAAFGECDSLTSINIPKSLESTYNTINYRIGEYGAFIGSDSLKTVTFEEGSTVVANGLFANTISLEEISIPNTITEIKEKAFEKCSNLKSVTLSDGLTDIGPAAFYGAAVTAVEIPDSVIGIGPEAFYDCKQLSEVKLSKSLKEIGVAAFGECDSLTSINIPKSLQRTYNTIFYRIGEYGAFIGSDNLKTVTFEEGSTVVANGLFANMASLEEIILPNTIAELREWAFENCVNLKTVSLSNTLQLIGIEAFRGCAALTEVVIPNSVTDMYESVFQDCTALKSVTLPEGRVNITTSMFENCTSLESIVLPKTVAYIRDHAFKNCTALKDITWSESLLEIQQYAFENCDALTVLDIPDTVTQIYEGAFYDCDALTSITVPDSVTLLESKVFYDNDALTTVKLSNQIQTIEDYLFYHCDALEEVVLPYGVKTMGAGVFEGATKFKSLTVPRTMTAMQASAFSYPDKLTIYGVAGTYAETFANDNKIVFVDKQVHADQVTLNETEVKMHVGEQKTLMMSVTPEDFTDEVVWKSSDTSIVEVDTYGKLKAKKTGTVTIKLSVGKANASCTVTVIQPVTDIYLYEDEIQLQALETKQLLVSIYPEDAANKEIQWTSSNPEIAMVDENGLVTALKKGNAVVRVEAQDGSGVYAECTVTVQNTGVIAEAVSQLESPHNYEVNCTDFWQFTLNDAENIEVTFDERTEIEQGFDYLYIYDGQGTQVGKYTGTELAGTTVAVPGNTVKIQLESDASGTTWGFLVTEVKAVVPVHEHSYLSEITKQPGCVEAGSVTYTCACGETYTENLPATGHKAVVDAKVEATCTTAGKSKGSHCSVCNQVLTTQKVIPAKGHVYSETYTVDQKASFYSTGKRSKHCKNCKAKSEEKTIARISTVKLSATSYVHSGRVITPAVTVKDKDDSILKLNTDYSVKYANGRKNPGQYSVVVTFKGKYSGSKTLSFKILPKAPKNLKATQTTHEITLSWSKVTGATGYDIYSYNTTSKRYTKLKSTSDTKITLKDRKSGTRYNYVVRAYTKTGSTVLKSDYSAVLKTATKPGTPTLHVSTGTKSATLTWKQVRGADGYVLYMAASKNGTYKRIATLDASKLKYTKSKLIKGKTYYFKLKAYIRNGVTIDSAMSSVKSVKIR